MVGLVVFGSIRYNDKVHVHIMIKASCSEIFDFFFFGIDLTDLH